MLCIFSHTSTIIRGAPTTTGRRGTRRYKARGARRRRRCMRNSMSLEVETMFSWSAIRLCEIQKSAFAYDMHNGAFVRHRLSSSLRLSHTNRGFQDILRSPCSDSTWRAADYNITTEGQRNTVGGYNVLVFLTTCILSPSLWQVASLFGHSRARMS